MFPPSYGCSWRQKVEKLESPRSVCRAPMRRLRKISEAAIRVKMQTTISWRHPMCFRYRATKTACYLMPPLISFGYFSCRLFIFSYRTLKKQPETEFRLWLPHNFPFCPANKASSFCGFLYKDMVASPQLKLLPGRLTMYFWHPQ